MVLALNSINTNHHPHSEKHNMYRKQTALPNDKRNDMHTLRSLLPYLWEYRKRVIIALIALILAKVAMVGAPLALKGIIDSLDPSQTQLILPLMLLLAYGALRIGSAFFNEIRDSVFARVRHGAMRGMSSRVVAHMHKLSLRFHLDRKTGAITRDLERGTRSVSSLLNYMVFSIIPILIEVTLIAIILLSYYSVWYAIVTFGTVFIYIAVTMIITEWRMKYRIEMNTMDSQANNQAIDSLINYETVKYFGNEKMEMHNYNSTLQKWEDAAVKSQTSLSALNVGQSAIIAIGVTIIMVMATQGVVDKELTIGDLVLVNAFMIQMFIPLNFLGIVYSQLKHALSDMDRMFKLLEENPEIVDKENAVDMKVDKAIVKFDHINFHYNHDRAILKNLNFTIGAGEKVAIVGASGAGKSTLARLLFRFYDVTGGAILIDDQDIRDVTQESLRAAIGIVPQDTVLFNDTIYYNIAYANPGADKQHVIQAAKTASIHDFILTLPEQYDTMVGERGLKLSGGEKQRVAIARAILKDPRIMVFDEATSSLDSRSEQSILEALRSVAVNHTTLIIAHRLSTIVDSDRILVIEHGEIIEQGTHQELLDIKNHYANMWSLQQQQRLSEQLDESS